MGGEAQHGILVLGPRAVDRLESYTPPWPLPKIFRLTSGKKLNEGIFKAATINTPSMLCIEDALDGLNWAISIGGLGALIERSDKNLSVLTRWIEDSKDVSFLAVVPETRSSTSVCIKITAEWFRALNDEERISAAKRVVELLDEENVAYDIDSYRDAPPGLRIWSGATVETSDLKFLTPWIDWALSTVAIEYAV